MIISMIMTTELGSRPSLHGAEKGRPDLTQCRSPSLTRTRCLYSKAPVGCWTSEGCMAIGWTVLFPAYQASSEPTSRPVSQPASQSVRRPVIALSNCPNEQATSQCVRHQSAGVSNTLICCRVPNGSSDSAYFFSWPA